MIILNLFSIDTLQPKIMSISSRLQIVAGLAAALLLNSVPLPAQQPDHAAVIRGIDASVAARNDNISGYTVTEHYAVYRNHDLDHPAAEMTVKTTYKKDAGKSYAIQSQSGSELLRKEVLNRILDNEKIMTQPAIRATAVITSANYEMKVRGAESVDGRNCIAVLLTPRRNEPFLFKGTAWVDAHDYAIVKLEGVAAKSKSMLTGAAQVSRQYAQIAGFPMATHATAISDSWLLGQTTVKIDYNGYDIRTRTAQ